MLELDRPSFDEHALKIASSQYYATPDEGVEAMFTRVAKAVGGKESKSVRKKRVLQVLEGDARSRKRSSRTTTATGRTVTAERPARQETKLRKPFNFHRYLKKQVRKRLDLTPRPVYSARGRPGWVEIQLK